MTLPLSDAALRLGVATALGAAIGLERELAEKNAGLRTHLLVSLGSALFAIVGIESAGSDPRVDPTRIAAQVVTGIGFLGAGAILKQGLTVLGLTTAATLWVTASVGMAAAYGQFVVAGLTSALALAALVVLGRSRVHTALHHRTTPATLEVSYSAGGLTALLSDLRRQDCEVFGVSVDALRAAGRAELATLSVRLPRATDPERLLASLRAVRGIRSVRLDIEALPPPG